MTAVARQHWIELLEVVAATTGEDLQTLRTAFGEYVIAALMAKRPVESVYGVVLTLIRVARTEPEGYESDLVRMGLKYVTPKDPASV